MALPQKSGRSRLTLVLLVLVSVTVLTLDFRDFGPVDSVQATARRALSPLTRAADGVFGPIGDLWQSVTDYDDLEAENADLRARLDELRGAAIAGQAAQATLDDVLTELDIDYVGGADRVTARVSDRLGNFDDNTIEIDKGTVDGVDVDMPVITEAGLVGRVVDAGRESSRVEIMSKPGYTVGVKIVGTGDIALATGSGAGADLTVEEGISDSTDVSVGDVVVTSGIEGSRYPADVPIGVVSDVEIEQSELRQILSITPAADLENLTFVTVVLWSVDAAGS